MYTMRFITFSALLIGAGALTLNTRHALVTDEAANPSRVQFVSMKGMGQANFEYNHPNSASEKLSIPNLGYGKAWTGFPNKVQWTYDYLLTQPDDSIVAMIDHDIMWGGCTAETFRQRYDKIVKASGAKVVLGAELGCFDTNPYLCQSDYPAVPQWAEKMYNLRTWKNQMKNCYESCPSKEDDLAGFQKIMPKGTTQISFDFADVMEGECEQGAHCVGVQKGMPYLNSGMVAGPAGDLRKVFKFLMDLYEKEMVRGPKHNDQGAFHQYWFASNQNEDTFYSPYDPKKESGIPAKDLPKMTLDYNSELVVNLYKLPNEFYTEQIKSEIGDAQYCFLHGNGKGKKLLADINVAMKRNA